MSKSNRKYWRQRAVNFENDWTNRCQETVEKQLARYYQKSLVAIKKDILQLYATFANDNGVDYNEAKRMLGNREIKEWRMGLQDYLQQIANGEKGFQTELNTLAMRPRISRLEKLYSETLQELDKLGRDVKDSMKNFLSNAYKENYCRDTFDLVKIGGMQVALAKIDALSVEKILTTRWSGKNYSQRIWKNTKLLSNAVKQTITSGVHRGLSIQQMSRNLEDKMQSGYRNAVLLVRTEMNFVNNQAHADSMKDAGIEYYEFIAVMDNKTSSACKSRDGETYLLEEKSVGFNYPPLHPRCRSTVCPFIEGVSKKGTRVAKVGKDTIQVPANMTYKDFEKVYLKKEISLETWNERIKNSGKVQDKVKSDFEKFGFSDKNVPRGLAASGKAEMAVSGGLPVLLGTIEDKSLVKPTLEYFEQQIVTRDVENAIIITASNDVYHCVGDKNSIGAILKLGDRLNGAYVTHNHPIGSANEYSFSDLDIGLFMDFRLAVLRGIDEKFVYELNRNPSDLDYKIFSIEQLNKTANKFNGRHRIVTMAAKDYGIGYRRWRRE